MNTSETDNSPQDEPRQSEEPNVLAKSSISAGAPGSIDPPEPQTKICRKCSVQSLTLRARVAAHRTSPEDASRT